MSNSEIFKAYEEGKHRRYNLLFAVNGGAFAIAKLLAVPQDKTGSVLVLGNLSLWQLSLGMALFTIVMVIDIFMFGQNMRKRMRELFGWQGKLVLILIGLLLCAGWSLVSFGMLGLTLVILGYFGSVAVVGLVTKEKETKIEELKQLNEYTFQAENKRSIGEEQENWDVFLEKTLADDFRISRTSREVQDKRELIEEIKDDKREREGPTEVDGYVVGDYGVVTSVVTVRDDPSKYHNFKVFYRQPSGTWQCVYWRVTKLTA